MTEEVKAQSQETLERTHAARQELDALIAEQRRLGDDLEKARREDTESRMDNLRAGGTIRGAVASLVSRARGVEDRAASLPEEIWVARMHVLELEARHNRERNAELEDPERVAQEEFREVDALLPQVQKRRETDLDRSTYLTRERRDHERREEDALTQLEALKRSGPEGR